jgi:hypothetical protein
VKRPLFTFALAAMLVLSTFATAIADGDRIGNDDNERTQRDSAWTDWHLVDANNPAAVYGTIDEIRYHSLADNPMRFFTVNDDLVVQWVSDEFQAGAGQQAYAIPGDAVPVSPGDMLGMYFAQTGTISFAGEGTIYSQGQDSGQPGVGDELHADRTVARTYSLVADIVPLTVTIKTVDETNLGVDWSANETRTGGSVAFVEDATSPYGGALQLTTDDTVEAKANLATAVAPVGLGALTALSYHTFQVEGTGQAAASYQLFVTFDDGSWTWLAYEPYWQNGTGDPYPVTAGEWQEWDLLDDGLFWSSRSAGGLEAGAGGPPLYTLDDVLASDSSATVEAIALNIGTYNPGWTVLADGMTFGTFDGITLYDFQPSPPAPADKDACKDGGWRTMTDTDGQEFRNQGDCVSYFASDGKTRGGSGKNR